jgi:hypothetical protein
LQSKIKEAPGWKLKLPVRCGRTREVWLTTSEGSALAKALSGIKDPKVHRSVVNLVQTIVGEED